MGLREAWQGWVLGRQKCDLLRLEKRPLWLDCPLGPQRLPLWGWGGTGPFVPISDIENKEVGRPKVNGQGPSAGQQELEWEVGYPFSMGLP